MKHIVAIIKANMLDDVIFALHHIEDFPGATISEVKGIGCGFHQHVRKNQQTPSFFLPAQIRMEIICNDGQMNEIVSAIEKSAHTGKPDDGKIFVAPIEEVVRIRTGQRGPEAI